MHPTYKRMLAGLQKKAKAIKRGATSREKWFLYILKCCDGSFYTGITKDLERRLKMHQAGKASRYTRSHRPVEMIYQEAVGNRTKALIRECAVKELSRKKKEELVSGATLNGQRKTKKQRCALRAVR
jgi:putative endonuclease